MNKIKTESSFYIFIIPFTLPVFGILLGLLLLWLGIKEYKLKRVTILGVFLIILSILFYYFAYYPNNIRSFKKARFDHTQRVLSLTIQSIEDYKTIHGKYPDSLIELNEDIKNPPFFEPYSFMREGKSKLFNYKKIGNGYILFSSGDDDKPNTKDDIYPNIDWLDTPKCGLILDSLHYHSN